MKKKFFIFALVAVLLVAGGVYTFEEGRNYVAKKVIDKLAQSEEVKGYRDKIEKAIEDNEDLIKEAAKNVDGVIKQNDENADLPEEESDDNNSDKDDKNSKDNKGDKNDKDGSGGGKADADVSGGDLWSHPLVQSVYSRFSAGEISQIMAAISGKATSAEKKAAKQMIFSRVSAAEISQLQELYNKYNN